jgi:hypothetical protein
MKKCPACGATKPYSEFGRHTRDGYRSRCKACLKAQRREKPRSKGKNSSEQIRRSVSRWGKKYPEKVRAKRALRRLAEQAACPICADRKAIASVYQMAVHLSDETGVPHEVDHIIPIRGKNVCGLHVHWNLRAIPACANHAKGNRLSDLSASEAWEGATP